MDVPTRRKKFRRELQDGGPKPNEYLYDCAADSVRNGTWYKDTPGMNQKKAVLFMLLGVRELCCMEEPDFSFLPFQEVIGRRTRARQVKFALSLTFKANAILCFKLESLDGNQVCEVEATYEDY